MNYRMTGVLSLGLAAVASLALYNTASTSAQPPQGTASRNSKDHAHDHDGHDHSHQPAVESTPPTTGVITAPSGGPPPLPNTRPAPSTSQGGDLPRESPSPLPADLPPTLLPPNSDAAYGFQPGNYDCPNARQNGNHSARDICPTELANQASPFEYCERQFAMPYTELRRFPRPSSYGHSRSRGYGLHEYRASFDSAEPCYQRFGHDVYGHGPTYYGDEGHGGHRQLDLIHGGR